MKYVFNFKCFSQNDKVYGINNLGMRDVLVYGFKVFGFGF